jgi:hypothetical protein
MLAANQHTAAVLPDISGAYRASTLTRNRKRPTGGWGAAPAAKK